MSLSNQILQYIAAQDKSRLPTLSPTDIAGALGANTERVSKLLWSLEHTGRIALLRDGRSIVGVKAVLRLEGKQGVRVPDRAPVPRQPVSRPSVAQTPALDRYREAKNRAEELKNYGDDYITVSFQQDQIAEEAIKLYDALLRLENQYRELSSQYKLMLYEYEGVKQRMKERVTKEVYAQKKELATL